ncbi:MAG: cache domain-containing protein [Eubacterium sp.]|nr:cache domain-containing protein [Eubacterium sp.]
MFTKIRQKVKNLKIRQRMLMVYAIGCFLPLLFVVFFMFYSTKNSLITMHLSDERSMLQDARDEIEASMDLAVELSDKLFFDTSSQRVGLLPISSGTETFYDYRQFGELRETVRKNFGNISSICVYVYPDTVDHVDNKNYRLITDTIREKPWFKKTMERRGLPSWSYLTDLGTGRRSIRLTRIFYNRYHREEGVISISLDPVLTNDLIMDMEN